MAKILLTGGSGQIGRELISRMHELTLASDVIYFLRHVNKVPVEKIKDRKFRIISQVEQEKPYDLAIHLAANLHTRYGNNKENYPIFYRDNVALTERVCSSSTRVLFTSSDYVFSGNGSMSSKETDPPRPSSNLYGLTKAEAEKIVLESEGSVIRLETMLGVNSNLILSNIYHALDGKDYWPFWDDCFVKPAFFEDFMSVMKKLVYIDRTGIYHVSCEGDPISRAEMAIRVLDIHKKHGLKHKNSDIRFESCTTDFPKHLALDTEITRSHLGVNFTNLAEALETHVLKTREKFKVS